ncbi:serine/threonine-protein kinase [Oceanicoccus sp. KOV_DT_Chl]|uniref:serine/threonine-protein kinase n=1 Tax=Oceanicoccus sp. KOV_DT_Chl TaxID=1904639 RepID=UPI000C799EBA|nr:serine/threonine-protein kinase [Oceanicoccus sp. KOV_DT_Chl]
MTTLKAFHSQLLSLPVLVLLLGLLLMYIPALPADIAWLDLVLQSFAGGAHAAQTSTQLSLQITWYPAVEQLVWTVVIIFMVLVLPRLQVIPSILLTFLLALLITVIQVLVLMKENLWFPFGVPLQFLLVMAPLLILIFWRQHCWGRLTAERDMALIELSRQSMHQGQLGAAFEYLQRCKPSGDLAEVGYKLAQLQEQRRLYDEASTTYQWLMGFAKKYKDVAKRARAITQPNVQAVDPYAATQSLATTPDLSIATTLGRYEIERELGRGAMGIVYLGRDPKISRQVAVKTLSYSLFPEADLHDIKARFFREAEAAGRLSHPNIVAIHDVGEEPDLSFIAMDFVSGQSLDCFNKPDTLLPVADVYRIIAQVAEALDYAHRQNIVHRDIKPGNLLYNRQEKIVKVADFGIARIIDDSRTKTGDILGSPVYMSPEQLKGIKVEGVSDIYSLGVTLYQLLTGEVPFTGDSIANLAYHILNKRYQSVRDIRSELPASAVRIVNKAMARDPKKRYQSAALMAQALHTAIKKDF